MFINSNDLNLPGLLQAPDWFQALRQKATTWQDLDDLRLDQIPYPDWWTFQDQYDLDEDQVLTYNLQDAIDNQVWAGRIVHAGNQTIYTSVETDLAEAGLIVMDLFEAMETYPDLVEKYICQQIPADMDRMAAYNLTHINGGIFIHVPDGMVLDRAIELTWVQDNRSDQAFNKRLVVVAGEQASFTLVERGESQGDFNNTGSLMTEIYAGQASQIKYVAFDRFGKDQAFYIRRRLQADRDAQVVWSLAAMNDGNTVEDMQVDLVGQGAQALLATIAVGDNQQVQGINAKIINHASYTVGDIVQHGAVLDDAKVTFNGIGHIIKAAKQADSQQESRLLMLSPGARGDANPILLIDEFEVSAGHAASIGRVDEDQLYYLMSRGLNRKQAEYLVIRGFLGQVFNHVKESHLRQDMIACLDHKLRHF